MIPTSITDQLGTWPGSLQEPELGAALVSAGILQANPEILDGGTEASGLAQRLEERLERAQEYGDVSSWRPPVEVLDLLSADEFYRAISSHGARVEIDPDAGFVSMAGDWQQALLTGAAALDGNLGVFSLLASSGSAGWRWPLPVGLLPDAASAAVAARLHDYTSWPELENLVPPEECDVLLVPHDVSALEALEVPPGVSPSLVVVLGSIDVDCGHVADFADRWADRFNASGCHFAGGVEATDWMRAFLREFSHNQPLDVTLARANAESAQRSGYTALGRGLVREVRLARLVEQFVRDLDRAQPRDIEVTDPVRWTLAGFPAAPVLTATEVVEYLADNAHEFRYDEESREATGVAELMRAVGELPTLVAANGGQHRGDRPEEIRVINGALFDGATRQRTALTVGVEYKLDVWIGQPTEDSDTLPGAAPIPTEDLPTGPKPLRVDFLSPRNHWPEQSMTLTLEDEGDTDHIIFGVQADEPGPFFGRIVVSYERRVLQTATVRARVVSEAPSRIGRPVIEVETVVRSHLAEIPGSQSFDLAMVVNNDDAGDHTASVITEDGVTLRSVDGLQQAKDDLVALLTQVADSPEDYSAITSQFSVELLFELATLGEAMHETFIADHGIKPEFFDVGRIQLISASPESYLPLELFYAGPPPTDNPNPILCDNHVDAAKTGTCSVCEAEGAESRDPMPICPAWFWGVRYVVERHAHDPEFKELPGDFLLQNEPTPQRNTLHMLKAVVMAMSGNVLSEHKKMMRKSLPGAASSTEEATGWDDLKVRVGASNPSLLLLLPHTEKLGVAFAMEIADDKLLRANRIRKEYVSPSGEPTIAALLGCDTANTEVPFQGLVPRFRRAGAGAVISTVNTVLGRHAVPVATKLLELAKAIPKDETVGMGELMRDLRRTTLSDGYPMVLSVVGFGDADWRIAGAGGSD